VARAVLDPGVLVSGLISPRAAPAELLRAWRRGDFELIVRPKLLEELDETLQRGKFRHYHTREEARAFVEHLRLNARLERDPDVPVGATPDPDDDYLVGLASSTGSDFLVSGDRHLTELDDPEPPVLTPRAFLDHLHALREQAPGTE
jgi:uncharacterized protein